MAHKGVLFFRGVPQPLRDRFKAECALLGLTMKQVVEEYMARMIARDPHFINPDVIRAMRKRKER